MQMTRKKSSAKKKILYVLAVMLAVAVVAGAIIYSYAAKSYDGKETRIYIDATSGETGLRDSLSFRLGEEYGNRVFSLWKKLHGDKPLKSGSYVVASGDKAYRVAKRICDNRQSPVKVTFNNLRRIGDLMSRLDDKLLADSMSLAMACDSILSGRGVAKANHIAHFLPDTYEFYWSDDAAKVMEKLTSYYDKFWNEERTAKAAALGLNPEQVSTLASIVEEETVKIDERPTVARLYINRLHRGMKLQADPTVKFAVGDFTLRRITGKHLEINSPYNTYKRGGLPPGPIRLPEAATLDAVINAPGNAYIYMCAKEDFSGYHNFATDYNAHLANAKRYQQALDARGIKQ